MVESAEEKGKRPASQRVANDLRARIEAGEYEAGSSLPTYRQLASEYDVAVNTALAAVRALRELGFVSIRRNAGAFVRDRSSDLDTGRELREIRDGVASLRSEVADMGSHLAELEKRLSDVVDRQTHPTRPAVE